MEAEFGSSEYANSILGQIWGFPPALELEKEAALQKCIIELINAGLVESAHDCSDGGLAVALAKISFAHHVGARIDLKAEGLPSEFALFGEDASRIVVSCEPGQVEKVREIAVKYGVAAEVIGETVSEQLSISVNGQQAVKASVSELFEPWSTAMTKALRAEAEEAVQKN
jgi:phosphoribosylformylglycinamidine synthase